MGEVNPKYVSSGINLILPYSFLDRCSNEGRMVLWDRMLYQNLQDWRGLPVSKMG